MGRVRAFRPPAGANIYCTIPLSTSWSAAVAGAAAEGLRWPHLSAAATNDMEFEVLDPFRYGNCGSQPFIGCIDDIENPNSRTGAFRFDASGKGAYCRLWAMVDVVGRWMRVGGRGGCKMEDDDGGRTGHPCHVPDAKHWPF